MAHRIPDRVLENFTGTSGNITTTGAISGHRTLASQLTVNADTGDFVLVGGTNGAQWEFTRLTRVSATEYSRAAAAAFPGFQSSTGSAITFGAGTLEVHSDIGAFFLRHLNTTEIAIASAATCDIFALHGLFVEITGSTGPITSFGTTPDQYRIVRFASTPTLTHHATDMILLDGVSRVMKAGDWGIYKNSSAGKTREVYFFSPGAWTAYTPTITATIGTFTTVSATGRYKRDGKTVHYSITITITTNGTAAGQILATLPFTAAAFKFSAHGFSNLTGLQLKGAIQASATQVSSITKYDFTYPGSSGAELVICGTYEAV